MTRQWAKPFVILLTVLFFNLYATAKEQRDTLGAGTQVAFIENLGQWDMQVRFEAQLHNAAIFLESDAITVALRDPIPHPAPFLSQPRYHAYRMTFSGATPVTPSGDNLLPGYNNFFLGNSFCRSSISLGFIRSELLCTSQLCYNTTRLEFCQSEITN